MADRVVSVKLKADISEYTASLAKAAAATRGLSGDVDKSLKDVGPRAERSGNDSGGLFAQGFRSGFVRNSPLIAAAVGAGLAAGAPVALAGAGVLFGGIGALAAAQTTQVRAAWTELGHDIRDGAVSDASVLVPVYEEMADKIGAAFQRMRPEIRDAFEAAAPQIDRFTDGLTGAAENALPGLVRAIEAGGPVIDGLATLMEDVGTGLSDFFDAMSDNSGAAGQALEGIGTVLSEALPLLGELLGTGAELAADVLPALGSTLGLVADVAHILAPILPAVVMGFVGFKAAQAAAGYLQTFAVQAQYATIAATGSVAAGERLGGAMNKTADGIGRAAGALPALGIVISGITSDLSDATTEEDKWAQAILAGGDASTAAYAKYQEGTHWGQAIDEATGLAASWDDAKAQADELRAQMSPLEQAQLGVEVAQRALNAAVDDHAAGSPEVIAAVEAYETAQEELRRKEGEVELAVDGVTQSMIDQANQALAAIDSGFAYRNSIDQLEDAQAALNTAIAENGPNSEAAQRAQLALEEQNYRTAVAFAQQQADVSGLKEGTAEYQRLIQTETLAELSRLRDAAGPEMAAAIQQQIDKLLLSGVALENTGAKTDTAAGKANGFRDAVNGIPAYKQTVIDADTGPANASIDKLMARLRSEGAFTVERAATAQNAFRRLGGAIGGIVHAYADGGFEPMKGGIAQVVAPNTWRVIGDRVRDDEAYIPINKSSRSQAILEQTAQRMGYGLAPNDLKYFAEGGIADRYVLPLGLTSSASGALEQSLAAKYGGAAGSGSVGGAWGSLWDYIKARVPQARINSAFRAGDPGYHGRGKALDVGYGSGPGGAGSAGLALINRTFHDGIGGNLAELIYDGIGDDRPDLKNGKPLVYSASTRADHRNHVHAAVYDQGGWLQPGYTMAYNGTGTPERVLTSREFSGGGRGGGGGAVTVAPPQVTVHFHVDGQEFRGMTRTEVDHQLGALADRVLYAGG